MNSHRAFTAQLVKDLQDVNRIDRAARIAKRFEEMNTAAAARQARRQLHVAAGLTLAALVAFLAIFHDTTARTAATVLQAEAERGAW